MLLFQTSKKAKDYLQCKGRAFPLFDSIGTLVEGHKATGKYVHGAIIKATDTNNSPAPPSGKIEKTKLVDVTGSTSAVSPLSSSPRVFPGLVSKSPSPIPSDGPQVELKAKVDLSSDEAPTAKRHRQSKEVLKRRAPTKPKKKSGIQMIDGISTEMKAFGAKIQSLIVSTSASIEGAAAALQLERPSPHGQAVSMIYSSSLARLERYRAVALFAEKPLLVDTYLNTPADERDDWSRSIID